MKKLITLFIVSISLGLSAQNFSGKATYQTKRIFKDIVKDDDKNPELTKQINEAMKKASEKTFFLEFTQDESLYTEEERLEQPQRGNSQVSVSINHSTSGKLYKNLKENYSLLESDYLDKAFLIKDSLHTSGWELGTETKKVGNYIVYKATKTIKEKLFTSEEEEEEEEEEEDNTNERELDLLSLIDKEPKDLIYIAWYTPEIPISNGPGAFGGLPGLILELHTSEMVYLCSEIVLNPKRPIKIKAPKGKTTSQKEYNDMLKERFKNMKKTKDGKGRIMTVETIRIGG